MLRLLGTRHRSRCTAHALRSGPPALGAPLGLGLALAFPSACTPSASVSPIPQATQAAPAPPPAAQPAVPPPAPTLADCAEWSPVAERPLAYPLRDGWVGSDGSAVLVGDSETVMHYDPGSDAWASRRALPGGWNAVWGSARDDVFAVGFDGAIAHFDGTDWSRQPSGTTSRLDAVWGTARDHVVAVGVDGTIVQYDGAAWSVVPSGVTVPLYAVWGSTANDMLAAGRNGTMLRFDGHRWTKARSFTRAPILALAGRASSDVYAATPERLFHYDGRRWSRSLAPSDDASIVEVATFGRAHVIALVSPADGGEWGPDPSMPEVDFYQYDGRSWVDYDAYDVPLLGVSESAAGHTHVFDERGWIHRHDEDGEHEEVGPDPFDWSRIHRIGSAKLGITERGDVWHHLDGDWEQLPATPEHRWRDAWIDDSGRVLVVGTAAVGTADERAAIATFSGAGWAMLWEGPRQRYAGLVAIRALGRGQLLAVGTDGLIVRGDASQWEVEPSGTVADLEALWVGEGGEAIAVGATERQRGGGVILHREGERWVPAAAAVDPLYDVWGTDGRHVYAVGGAPELRDDGWFIAAAVMRFDGKSWSAFHGPPSRKEETLTRIAGNSPRDVFALRTYPITGYATWSLLHSDGGVWTEHASGQGDAGALSVTPNEVVVSTDDGPYRWGCRRAGEPPSAE